MSVKKQKVYIGCSGFSYGHWKGDVFYPEGLAQRLWLEHYSGIFDTVELNVTFYRLPADSTFISWKNRTPENFLFVCKGSKLITHSKQGKGLGELTGQFMERVSLLEGKLGPILWQFKPGLKLDAKSLREFIGHLENFPGTLHAFEFRDKSWFNDRVYKMLSDAGMTFCLADYPRGLPKPPDDFAFIYLRRHGPEAQAYRGSYPDERLVELAGDIRRWKRAKKAVYCYFNNDIGGHAPSDALRLKDLLKGKKGG